MLGDVEAARTAALRTFLGVRRLASAARALERAAGAEVAVLGGLATILDALAYQAQGAVRAHAGCLVAAELSAADPTLDKIASRLARGAEAWAAILETVATASLQVYAQALDAARPVFGETPPIRRPRLSIVTS